MQTLVVPKNRKPRFTLTFRLLDLNNIPYVSGGVLLKWHLSSSADHGDHRTAKVPIKDHRAIFDYEKSTSVRMVVDKNGVLQESILLVEVIHEVPTGGKEDRSLLGSVRVNLAEYVEATRLSSEGVQRRHLLLDSKINSTLKVAIHLNQIEGDRTFLAPPLRSAPVFVGIAGVMAGEEVQNADAVETLNFRNREAGDELRDLYHKTLAAGLTCQAGVPNADQIVEDIFSGGDGWCGPAPSDTIDYYNSNRRRRIGGGSIGGGGITTSDEGWSDDVHSVSSSMRPNKRSWPDLRFVRRGSNREHGGMRATRASFGQGSGSDLDKEYRGSVPEVDELEVRDDLRCWNYTE